MSERRKETWEDTTDKQKTVDVVWEEPAEAPRATSDDTAPEDARSLLADLAAIVGAGRAAPLADVVASGSKAESFLRLSLLPLVGDARAGEGFAGQLGALPLDVEASGDGWPEPVEGRPVASLTPGEVVPRAHLEKRHG